MPETESYCRSPLPPSVKMPVVPVAFFWAAIALSPVVAFAVNGRVEGSDWTPAFATAGLALTGFLILALRARINWLNLPPSLRAEYEKGKLYPPLAKNEANGMHEYPVGPDHAHLVLDESGVTYTFAAFIRASYGLAKERALMETLAGSHAPARSVAWTAIQEWQVHADRDGPDYYCLKLADGEHICLRRTIKSEPGLLDYVRGTGQIPVRLFCDVPDR